jgi:RimJ/RimL family protein N-acetyltransferase
MSSSSDASTVGPPTVLSVGRAAGQDADAGPGLPAGHLRDGTPVWVRPLVAGDRDLLLAGFRTLSSRSRYSRFLTGTGEAQFERMLPILLDSVDQQSHVALVLYTEDLPIAVGRLRRSAVDAGVADLAVTVLDDWQGRGAGTVLAREVLARADGIREIHTVVAEDNQASLRMLARLGELRTDCAGGNCDVVVRVHRAPSLTTAEAA